LFSIREKRRETKKKEIVLIFKSTVYPYLLKKNNTIVVLHKQEGYYVQFKTKKLFNFFVFLLIQGVPIVSWFSGDWR
jgi:hypothetical protein